MARELHPGRGIAFSADAHYTHSRMCGLLGVEGHPVAVDRPGGWTSTPWRNCCAPAGWARWC